MEYGIRKCRRERNYMGGKSRGMWGSAPLEEGPRTGMLKRILGGKVRDKSYRKCRKKRNYGNVEQDTIVGWEIEQKLTHEGLLVTQEAVGNVSRSGFILNTNILP